MITEGNRIKNKNSRKKRVIFPVLTIFLVLGVVLYVLLREEVVSENIPIPIVWRLLS